MSSHTWLFDVDYLTAHELFTQVQQRCCDLELLSHTVEKHDSPTPNESYDILEYAKGQDRIRIVLGHELNKDNSQYEYWILVELMPWWRRPWNRLHEHVIPIIEDVLKK